MKKKQLELAGIEPSQKFCYTDSDNKTVQITKFFVERHKIYLRRADGLPREKWTSDYALANFRFCNIYRQLDTVSLWIYENVLLPNEDNPNLPVLLALSRLINWPPTIRMLIEQGVWPETRFNRRRFYDALLSYKQDGNKVVTGAYIVHTVYPKDFPVRDPSKGGYIADVAAVELWENRNLLAKAGKTTLEEFAATMRTLHGWGNFMTYQTLVDLTYSKKWLGRAEDLNTFVSPGPGTQRGLNRYFTGSKKPSIKKGEYQELLIQQREEVNRCLKKLVPKDLMTGNFRTGFAELEMSNVHNLNCEFDKHQRVFYGEGEMKNTYRPQKLD